MVLALMVWAGQVRPPVLVSADGGLLGVQGAQGRVLSAPRGNGFTASIWLENDGDRATQDEAATREGFSGPKGNRRVMLGETRIAHLTGKGALAHLAGACAEGALVVTGATVPDPPPGCRVIDAARLAQTGPVALWPDGAGGLTLRPTKAAQRVWSGAVFVPPDDG